MTEIFDGIRVTITEHGSIDFYHDFNGSSVIIFRVRGSPLTAHKTSKEKLQTMFIAHMLKQDAKLKALRNYVSTVHFKDLRVIDEMLERRTSK